MFQITIFLIVLSTYIFSLYWFFIRMVFFDPSRVMLIAQNSWRVKPIGIDLMMMLSHSQAWLTNTISPYASYNNFPPLATFLFTPLSLLPMDKAYMIITLVTFASVIWIGLIFPFLYRKKVQFEPIHVLLFAVGITSYGFQFELERGQWYSIAMALTLAGILLFHRYPRLSWIAYILFTIAIQLKISPVLFIFLFIRDWRKWKENLLRIGILGAVNLGLLFVLGMDRFQRFIQILLLKSDNSMSGKLNLSIKSFVQYSLPYNLGRFHLQDTFNNSPWMSNATMILLSLIIVGLLAIAVIKAYRVNQREINPYLLFACTCTSMLIMPISFDYKLPIMIGPTAILFYQLQDFNWKNGWERWLVMILTAALALTYFSTQFLYEYKSPLLASNFPGVFLMFLIGTAASFLPRNAGGATDF
jgi:hypothetical protein